MRSTDFLFRMLSVAPQAFVAVDAALGRQPVKSVSSLRDEVLRWRDESGQRYSDDECEHLVRWLNRNFYKL
jgi:hypothetical protein